MTLLELVTHLRTNILYDTGGTNVDWTAYSDTDADSVQLRWTNEELVANINEAINQVYRRTNYTKDTWSLSVIAGTTTYAIPSYIKEIVSGRRADGQSLTEESLDFFMDSSVFNTQTGDLKKYIPDVKTGNLQLYPKPDANETVIFYVYRLPKTKLSWFSYESSPELAEDYQIPMLFGAAALCYMKDEANTFDPNRAAYLNSLFDREFPFTSAYSNIRKGRTVNKGIRYGGL